MLAVILLQAIGATLAPAGPAPTPGQVGLFRSEAVDFWGTRKREAASAALWAEGGRPAGPVADLIEQPSRENALKYLDWQRDRLQRLEKAMAVLEEVQRPAAAPAGEILYFTREGCAWCARQDAVIQEMGLAVRRVTPAEPELWLKHRVTATPTLVVPGREPLRGFRTRAQIEQVLK